MKRKTLIFLSLVYRYDGHRSRCFTFFKILAQPKLYKRGKHRILITIIVVNLLVDQVEFANVIILNKTDLVTQKNWKSWKLRSKIESCGNNNHFGFRKVPISAILNTGLFNYEEAESSAGWIQELEGIHTPETEEYGISSFVFRDERPFHPQRFGTT
jgi:G3E family GTPase